MIKGCQLAYISFHYIFLYFVSENPYKSSFLSYLIHILDFVILWKQGRTINNKDIFNWPGKDDLGFPIWELIMSIILTSIINY